jgi:hypothetical protein
VIWKFGDDTTSTMVTTSTPGGIGAIGSAMARFFHPSKKIRAQWPHDEKRRLTGVLVIGEGVRRVNRKEQMCYIVRIPEIDDGSTFHIIKKIFKVDSAGPQPFESECGKRPQRNEPAAAADSGDSAERASQRNVVANVEGREMDLEDLARQGVAVDDDNVPAPENNTLPTLSLVTVAFVSRKEYLLCMHMEFMVSS